MLLCPLSFVLTVFTTEHLLLLLLSILVKIDKLIKEKSRELGKTNIKEKRILCYIKKQVSFRMELR